MGWIGKGIVGSLSGPGSNAGVKGEEIPIRSWPGANAACKGDEGGVKTSPGVVDMDGGDEDIISTPGVGKNCGDEPEDTVRWGSSGSLPGIVGKEDIIRSSR